MSFQLGDEEELRSEINVTPLVDVMLVLLVIFMVVTPLLHHQLPVELPQARTAEPQQAKSQVHLQIAADGSLRLNDQVVEPSKLAETLHALFATSEEKTIFLEADRSLPYASIIDAMDACRGAGVERIGVLTRPHEAPAER